MEQMNTDGLTLVRVDYDAEDIPESVKQTHPVIYEDGQGYCCLLGPDPATGIFGRGKTLREAMADFDRHFQDRLEHPIKGDPVSEFIQQRHI
jgi:hypothetical protein